MTETLIYSSLINTNSKKNVKKLWKVYLDIGSLAFQIPYKDIIKNILIKDTAEVKKKKLSVDILTI